MLQWGERIEVQMFTTSSEKPDFLFHITVHIWLTAGLSVYSVNAQDAMYLYFTNIFIVFLRYVVEKVDLVIVGAEGVVESGGIINKVSKTHTTHTL